MLLVMRWGGLLLGAGIVMGIAGIGGLAPASSAPISGGSASAISAVTPPPGTPRVAFKAYVPQASRVMAPVTPTPTGPLSCADMLAPVDKQRGLSSDCVPPNLVELPNRISFLLEDPVLYLRAEAATSLLEMFEVAEGNGLYMVVRSAYRGYWHQAEVFDYWRWLLGEAEAERTSARPGHSEHQLGTAVDVTSASNGYDFDGFQHTAEGKWVAQYAYLFGFVISYPEGKENVTGYTFEPWHLRYIGRANAKAFHESGLTLREWLAR